MLSCETLIDFPTLEGRIFLLLLIRLIEEEVKAPIPNAVAAGYACSAIFVGTSVAGSNVLVSSVYQYYVRKQIPTNSVSLRCLSIPTLVVRPLSVVITAS